jgi:G3E family GTPase
VAIVEPGAVNGMLLNEWLGFLLQTQGADIFRMKGIVNVQGEDHRHVFQGVHMLFDGMSDRLWRKDEIRKNELVFIGRNLKEAQLKAEFRKCLV